MIPTRNVTEVLDLVRHFREVPDAVDLGFEIAVVGNCSDFLFRKFFRFKNLLQKRGRHTVVNTGQLFIKVTNRRCYSNR